MSATTVDGAQVIPTIIPMAWTDDEHLKLALSDLGALLSRFASGQSVQTVANALYKVVWDIVNIPAQASEVDRQSLQGAQGVFRDLGVWVEHALNNPEYAASSAGHSDISDIFDHTQTFLHDANTSDTVASRPWVQDVRVLVRETETFTTNLASDKSTQMLLSAMDGLSSSFAGYVGAFAEAFVTLPQRTSLKARQLVRHSRNDILMWLLPHLVRAISAVPMPRVEYKDDMVEVVIDALLLTSSSFGSSLIPDHIRFQMASDVEVDLTPSMEPDTARTANSTLLNAMGMGSDASLGGVRSYTRVKLHIGGIRMSAGDIGYYMRYKGPLGLGYEDEGLVSVDVGTPASSPGDWGQGGVSLDVDLEVDTTAETEDELQSHSSPLFTVRDVHLTIPQLQFTLTRTKHSIVNRLIQPFLGPATRAMVGYYLRRQIWTVLDELAALGGKIHGEAETLRVTQTRENDGGVLETYWTAALNVIKRQVKKAPREFVVNVETYTHPTVQGVIRTTKTYPAHSSASPPSPPPLSGPPPTSEEPETSTLAIGIGPQLLPGKGGPHTAEEEDYGLRDAVREALSEVQGALDGVVRTARAGEETVDEVRRDVADVEGGVWDAGRNGRRRYREEARREGWSSHAFDL